MIGTREAAGNQYATEYVNQANIAKRVSQVDQYMMSLEKVASSIEMAVSGLDDRLSPVLRGIPPSTAQTVGIPVETGLVSVAAAIRDQANRLDAILQRIHSITERLEV